MNRIWLLLTVLIFSGPTFAQVRSCESQEAAFNKANAEYEKANTPAKNFFRSFYQNGSSASLSLATEKMKKALDGLTACRSGQDGDRQEAAHEAMVAEYNARPEVRAKNKAIEQANASVDGHVNVETFTPYEWLRGMGLTPWIPLGKTESKAFFYTFGSKDYQTYINIKTATLGAGDDYILMEFLAAQIDCRPGNGYPAALPMPTTYSYNGNGRSLMDDVTNPLGVEVPVEHGTVLAEAVIGTCDAVRKHDGTVNYQG